MTYSQIAGELGLSRHTVGEHIQHIYERLSVRTKIEAVLIGIARGIIRV